MNYIQVRGARIHHLKNIDVTIPKGKFVVFTGVSGSGKSSLAFDILYEEGRRRYLQSIGLNLRGGGADDLEPFDDISGLPPAISVEQNTILQSNPRSVVGTKTKILDYIKLLFALEGKASNGRRTNLPIEAFAYNLQSGMCKTCYGRGFITDIDIGKIIPDPSKTTEKICALISTVLTREIQKLSKENVIVWVGIPYEKLPSELKQIVLYGQEGFTGVITWIRNRIKNKPNQRQHLEKMYGSSIECEHCQGYRVNETARRTFISGKHVGELCSMTMTDLSRFMDVLQKEVDLTLQGRKIAERLTKQLYLILDVGLSHLTVLRSIPTLSGGELQRLYLMFHLQSQFDSLLYVFDEPTAGLHESEKHILLHKLKSLTTSGNTVIVVEHDANIMLEADYIVELGPSAGKNGGQLIFQGAIDSYLLSETSGISPYLSGKKILPYKKVEQRRNITEHNPKLLIRNANLHNLKDVTAAIPLGVMVGVAGVSGSGKSTLISDTLVPLLRHYFDTEQEDFVETDELLDKPTSNLHEIGTLEGWQSLEKCVVVTQEPIGRSKMSMPITYVGIWDKIRNIFAEQQESVNRGYTSSNFSFNTDQGACPSCKGDGVEVVDMGPLGLIKRPCLSCKGTRYQEEVLQVTFKGKSIHDVLLMSVEEALELFSELKAISLMLQTLIKVGLGYISLGQPAPTLSGGEAQRIKLAKELGKVQKKNTLYVLDEPTSGLSFPDIEKLILLLDELTEQGNTVIITEHDTAILSWCDWIIEMGPHGGSEGGKLITEGTPEMLSLDPKSKIGLYLNRSTNQKVRNEQRLEPTSLPFATHPSH
ncbi:excinuclease ABC subunit UvrA [Paenibacillus eucommiae]|uniref:UvrABC system protein A n=1 Tax=Paenibacillus eucommiae TaxID=1355755 RepID=A0ABS4IP88_9BACL|nr:excinuclease ABC subunit UvrA [Paenibacillus eucommiae]MBP1989378.1 excinuclease ABC A subunit [Paenibacillus eucommiae]